MCFSFSPCIRLPVETWVDRRRERERRIDKLEIEKMLQVINNFHPLTQVIMLCFFSFFREERKTFCSLSFSFGSWERERERERYDSVEIEFSQCNQQLTYFVFSPFLFNLQTLGFFSPEATKVSLSLESQLKVQRGRMSDSSSRSKVMKYRDVFGKTKAKYVYIYFSLDVRFE